MSVLIDGNIKVIIWGESHGSEIGGVIDGFPHGVKYDEEFVLSEMARRAPGSGSYSTKRKESDLPIIVSGMKDGVTTGSPIAFRILNENTRSADYDNIGYIVRPSHADYSAYVRFDGMNDVRGGGHFSGRLTAPMVFAGALAKLYLKQFNVKIGTHIMRIGNICDESFIKYNDVKVLDRICGRVPMLDSELSLNAEKLIEDVRKDGDSIGCIIECGVYNVKAGLGGYMARGVEPRLSEALFSVPAVKSIEFGSGKDYVLGRGSEMNDAFETDGANVVTTSNNNGGILGGITTGMPVVFSVGMKPTPSIYKPQKSVDIVNMKNEELVIKGRHDPCVGVRAVPVIESVAALVFADIYMEALGYNGKDIR